MKLLVVFVLILLAAATALAYGHPTVTAGVSAVVAQHAIRPSEPGVLLLSGSALLAAAGLVKRLTI